MCGYVKEDINGLLISRFVELSIKILNKEDILNFIFNLNDFRGFLCNKFFLVDLFCKKNLYLDEDIYFCEDLLFCC